MKIIQAKDDNDEVDQALGNEVHSNQRTKMTSNQDSRSEDFDSLGIYGECIGAL